jgi:hypothetical protein
MLATIRNFQGGWAGDIVGSTCQLGFMSSDEQNGFWLELNHASTNGQNGNHATVYAVSRNAGVETRQQVMTMNNPAVPLVVYFGAKATIEITVKSNKVRVFVSVENFDGKSSYGQQNYYNRYLDSGGVVELTTNLPANESVIEPTFRYAPTTGTTGGRALTFFSVKSRYI